jgi:hypothetical protein
MAAVDAAGGGRGAIDEQGAIIDHGRLVVADRGSASTPAPVLLVPVPPRGAATDNGRAGCIFHGKRVIHIIGGVAACDAAVVAAHRW